MTPNEYFKQGLEQNKSLVDLKSTRNPDLFILKYKKKCFFDDIWNEFIETSRGTVVDKDFNIVSLPFQKIYNYGIEERAPIFKSKELLQYSVKVNGFMAAITSYKGDILVSTTGSIDSDFVGYVNHFLEKNREEWKLFFNENSDWTFLFECVHPDDPHIIDEEFGLHYLGARKKQLGSVVTHIFSLDMLLLGAHLPKIEFGTIDEIKEIVNYVRHEGFVIYAADGTASKIKSPYYLGKKMFMRGNVQKLLNGRAREYLDEEYYPLIDHIQEHREEFELLNESQRKIFLEKYFEEQLARS